MTKKQSNFKARHINSIVQHNLSKLVLVVLDNTVYFERQERFAPEQPVNVRNKAFLRASDIMMEYQRTWSVYIYIQIDNTIGNLRFDFMQVQDVCFDDLRKDMLEHAAAMAARENAALVNVSLVFFPGMVTQEATHLDACGLLMKHNRINKKDIL
jgi:hypothetical protein